MFGSGVRTLIILNEEMNNIMKIVKSFEQSGLLIQGNALLKQLKMKQKTE